MSKQDCKTKDCGCPIPDLSTSCIIYDGETLSCIGADTPDDVSSLLKKFDTAICNKLDFALSKGNLRNIGEGIELYKGVNGVGERELRTFISSDDTVEITINPEDESIDLKVDIPEVSLPTLENISTNPDANVFGSFNAFTNTYNFRGLKSQSLTIGTDQLGNINIEAPVQPKSSVSSDDKSVSVTQVGNNYDLEVNFPSPPSDKNFISSDQSVDIQVSENDVDFSVDLQENVQGDVLESNSNNEAFIRNKNPQKTINSNYTLQASDNNYTIVVDSTVGSISINTNAASLPNNFFVGLVQKGGNAVNFTGTFLKALNTNAKIDGQARTVGVEKVSGDVFLIGDLEQRLTANLE